VTSRPGAALLSILLLLGASQTACDEDPRTGGGPSVSTDGPLSASTVAGGSSIYAPDNVPWSGSFGGFALCTLDGSPLTIEGITYEANVALDGPPEFGVRVVDTDTDMLGSWLGGLDDFDESTNGKVPGRLEEAKGFQVDRKCRKTWPQGFDELLVSLESDGAGAWLTQLTVSYHDSNAHSYELVVPWEFVLCGTDVEALNEGDGYCARPSR